MALHVPLVGGLGQSAFPLGQAFVQMYFIMIIWHES
jgi:hypothetical protein